MFATKKLFVGVLASILCSTAILADPVEMMKICDDNGNLIYSEEETASFYPIGDCNAISKSRGGNLDDVDAAFDSIGAVVMGPLGQPSQTELAEVNNSGLITLIQTHGAEAKEAGKPVVQYVQEDLGQAPEDIEKIVEKAQTESATKVVEDATPPAPTDTDAPVFSVNSFYLVPDGSIDVFNMNATDASPITYSVEGTYASYFEIDATGTVGFKEAVYFYRGINYFPLTVVATDSAGNRTAKNTKFFIQQPSYWTNSTSNYYATSEGTFRVQKETLDQDFGSPEAAELHCLEQGGLLARTDILFSIDDPVHGFFVLFAEDREEDDIAYSQEYWGDSPSTGFGKLEVTHDVIHGDVNVSYRNNTTPATLKGKCIQVLSGYGFPFGA